MALWQPLPARPAAARPTALQRHGAARYTAASRPALAPRRRIAAAAPYDASLGLAAASAAVGFAGALRRPRRCAPGPRWRAAVAEIVPPPGSGGLPADSSRTFWAIVVARCLNMLTLGLVMSSSTAMIYELASASMGVSSTSGLVHAEVQKFFTYVGTAATLVGFLATPYINGLLDARGRRPAIVLSLAMTGLGRLLVASKPCLPTFFLYILVVSVSLPAFFDASGAALGDIFGRGTPERDEKELLASRFSFLCIIAGSFMSILFAEPRAAMAASGLLQLVSAAVALWWVRETLVDPKTMDWSLRNLSPLTFVKVFRKSRALTALGVLTMVVDAPQYLNVVGVYQRQRFAGSWGRTQESIQRPISMAAKFLGTLVAAGTMGRLGLRGAARLDAWCSALYCLSVAYAPRMEVFFLVPLISIFQHGGMSLQRVLQLEADKVGVGVGELAAAQGRMDLFAELLMPYFFTFLYMRFGDSLPQAPFLAAMVGHLIAGELVLPWAFRRLSPSVAEKARPTSAQAAAAAT